MLTKMLGLDLYHVYSTAGVALSKTHRVSKYLMSLPLLPHHLQSTTYLQHVHTQQIRNTATPWEAILWLLHQEESMDVRHRHLHRDTPQGHALREAREFVRKMATRRNERRDSVRLDKHDAIRSPMHRIACLCWFPCDVCRVVTTE